MSKSVTPIVAHICTCRVPFSYKRTIMILMFVVNVFNVGTAINVFSQQRFNVAQLDQNITPHETRPFYNVLMHSIILHGQFVMARFFASPKVDTKTCADDRGVAYPATCRQNTTKHPRKNPARKNSCKYVNITLVQFYTAARIIFTRYQIDY